MKITPYISESEELFEIKISQIKVGQSFSLGADLGKFKKGDRIKVRSIIPNGDDYAIKFKNPKGFVDIFYIDKEEDVVELEPIDEITRMQQLAGIIKEAPDNPINLPPPDPNIPQVPQVPENPAQNISTITHEQAKAFIKTSRGKVFTATFIKKDGTTRVMNARLGVTAYLKGGELPFDAESKGMVPVWDLQVKGYRLLTFNAITQLKMGGQTYNVI